MKWEIIFVSSNYNLSWERLSGIHRDIHSHDSRHGDDGGGSRDSRRDGSHHRRIHILHHIRGRLQERWLLPPRRTLQTKTNNLVVALLQKHQVNGCITFRENTESAQQSNEEDGLHDLK